MLQRLHLDRTGGILYTDSKVLCNK